MVAHHGVGSGENGHGLGAVTPLLDRMRCIQLDPLDRIGANADLVAMARIDGLGRGEVFDAAFQGGAFEHFAKERCLLPARSFPYYRDRAIETPQWRLTARLKRLDPVLVADVLAEVRERGPVTPAMMSDRGRVKPMDWNGWRGTSKSATMALEVLWTRAQVVVSGRSGRSKVYDVPERALPDHAHAAATIPYERWALLERVDAAGMLNTATGPWWSMLRDVRTSTLPGELVEEGVLQRVRVHGARRCWLARPGFESKFVHPDERMHILGPLDPLIWDRAPGEVDLRFRVRVGGLQARCETDLGLLCVPFAVPGCHRRPNRGPRRPGARGGPCVVGTERGGGRLGLDVGRIQAMSAAPRRRARADRVQGGQVHSYSVMVSTTPSPLSSCCTDKSRPSSP